METGNLSIHAENLLPIIKKWLYSDRDIFVRELVSNACDAITKRKALARDGQCEEADAYSVVVTTDEAQKTLTISDNGIGMTAEEVKKYINQVAFSGAEDFVKKVQEMGEGNIIGHFGLGFYSAFMVAETIEIQTLSCLPGSEPVLWQSDGGMTFQMDRGVREIPGTDIILHVNDESHDFLHTSTLRETLLKYCAFMPTPIYLDEIKEKKPEAAAKEDEPEKAAEEAENAPEEETEENNAKEPINTVSPLYLKAPKDCTEQEYKDFYRDTFFDWQEPLFWIHLNADYPFNLKGILYFPRRPKDQGPMDGQVKLYSNQVFVADNIKEVVPEYLLLLKGVIDCPDIPLNVSRSFLQNDGYVKRLSDYIARKVADRLTSLFENDREQYCKYWDDIHPFVKYGCIRDEKFADRVKDCVIFKTTEDTYVTLKEYLEKAAIPNKIIYTSDRERQAPTIGLYEKQGVQVVVLDAVIDTPFMQSLEMKNSDVKFQRVDADLADVLRDSDGQKTPDEEKRAALEKLFRDAVSDEKLTVKLEPFKDDEVTAVLLHDETLRRYRDASAIWGDNGMPAFPVDVTLALNAKNPLVSSLASREAGEETLDLARQIYDLAELGQQPLSAERMSAFVERSQKLLSRLV